jgi:acyl-CoA synthetase (NDP forming)
MPLIGPNCYGLLNYLNGAMLWPDQQGGQRVDEGVAIITMSSNVGFNLTMQRRGLPIAYMLSPGKQAEVCTSLKRFQGGSTGRSERRRGCHLGSCGHGRK